LRLGQRPCREYLGICRASLNKEKVIPRTMASNEHRESAPNTKCA
jgi:hypothetical protein